MGFFKRRSTPELPVEALIVGLGNPGPQYARTRHNVGFDVVEALARAHSIPLKTHKFQSQYGVGVVAGRGVAVVKPMTFMNLSGRAVAAVARHFKVARGSVLVVSDDLDLDVGRVRMKPKGGSGGHNGHKSVIESLGGQDYPRIKIGIGKDGEGTDHVLNRFKPEERALIDAAVGRSVRACEIWLEQGVENAMNWCNAEEG